MERTFDPIDRSGEKLALLEGAPVHVSQWPSWPRAGRVAQRAILNVLHSEKWTVSGRSRVFPSQERRFSEMFSSFVGRRFGVACASGTAALTIALQALDVGPGDEVILPGLTWVACASAVINIGAVPILVDVDPHALCITADTIEATISPQTRAVLGIHMYSSRADLSAINAVCAARGVALIEDASQAHGAWIGAQRTGSFGAISIFSFQQSKLLTGGEGGIAVTDDDVLYQRMQQFRADGRLYADPEKDRTPFAELVVKGDVLGRNLCMTEFQAVLLQEGLGRLDTENTHRRGMATHLARRLADVQWVSLIRDQLDPAAGATFYKIPLRVADARLVKLGPTLLARALTAELNLPVEPLDRPLNQAPLYCPERAPLVLRLPEFANRCAPGRFSLPNAEEAWRTSVCLPHQCLMGSEFDIDSIVVALQKVQLNAATLELVAQTDAELRGRPS